MAILIPPFSLVLVVSCAVLRSGGNGKMQMIDQASIRIRKEILLGVSRKTAAAEFHSERFD
jgi:hypothetical protein